MTVTLTYDSANARVSIACNGMSTTADYATIERSVDQIIWTMVRGCGEVEVSGGSFVDTQYDYEFRSGVVNYYRVRDIRTDPISFVTAGTASTGSSGSRTPGLPGSMQAGDLVLIWASTRNSGTGTVDDITNWTTLATWGNTKLLGRIYDGVWTMPTVTFTGGAANEDTIAQSAAFRNAGLVPATSAATLLNSSAANIAHPALTVPDDDLLLIAAAWKQDDFTSVAVLSAPATWSEIQEASTTAGNDASQVWDYLIQTTAANVSAASFTVTGGASAISRAVLIAFEHAEYITSQSSSLTPTVTAVWIKSTMRSFLNRSWTLAGPGFDAGMPARGSTPWPIGRSYPIGISDTRGSRQFSLAVITTTLEDARRLDYVLAAGDILFLQAPDDIYAMFTGHGYVMVAGEARAVYPNPNDATRITVIPLREVVAPGPDIATVASTWDSLIGDWDDPTLVTTYPTWDDLKNLVGDPDEVIVA